MKQKLFALIIVLFSLTFAYPSAPTSPYYEIKDRIDSTVRSLGLSETGTHLVFPAPHNATFIEYADAISHTEFSKKSQSCSSFLISCQKWKKALRIIVADNKEGMRNFYLGCKLAYHALSQTDVNQEVPDEVLVTCYGDVVIPEGTKLYFSRRLFLESFSPFDK